MRRRALLRLVLGFRKFREKYFESEDSPYRQAGQQPATLVIACSDSRVDPAIITSARPGELFVVRNVANLVPPYEVGGGYHGVSSAIEFAIVNLKVENVIILGHRQCGGIKALVSGLQSASESFVERWMTMARPAHFRALAAHPDANPQELCQICEHEAIKVSIENLRTFPFVVEAEKERGMNVIGAYFDLERGVLEELNESTGEFSAINV